MEHRDQGAPRQRGRWATASRALLIAAGLCCLLPLGSGGVQAVSAAAGATHRYVIFLNGVTSQNEPHNNVVPLPDGASIGHHVYDAVSSLEPIYSAVTNALPAACPVFFSYAAGPDLVQHKDPSTAWSASDAVPQIDRCRAPAALGRLLHEPLYQESDTKKSLIPVHAAGLTWLIGRIVAADPAAEIDLVGFSLGGVVAMDWAASKAGAQQASHLHGIMLIESPVGGTPLAASILHDCQSNGTGCSPVLAAIQGFFGRAVLESLALQTPGIPAPKHSVVGDLTSALRRFDVTAIQSTADYLVNGASLSLCWTDCSHPISTAVGIGAQYWTPAVRHHYFASALGQCGNGPCAMASAPLGIVPAIKLLRQNHEQPLSDPTTATWVVQALETSGPRWEANRSAQPPPIRWMTLYVAATDPGVTRVNLRAGPGTRYPILLQIPNRAAVKADPTPVHGDGGAPWYRVRYGGKTGYVLAELLSRKRPAPVVTRPTPQPAPPATNQAPPAGWVQHTSAIFPYNMATPADWRASTFTLAGKTADIFLGSPVNGFTTNVTVVAAPVNSWVTLAAYKSEIEDATNSYIQTVGGDASDFAHGGVTNFSIDGAPADVFYAHLPQATVLGGGPVDSMCFVVVRNGQGWQITLDNNPAVSSDERSVFMEMVGSFRFLD